MNSIKQRFTLGVLFGGILLAATMTPAQAVFAASNDTPSSTTSSQSSPTTVPVTNDTQPSTNTNTSPSTTTPDNQNNGSANTPNAQSSTNQTSPQTQSNTPNTTSSNGDSNSNSGNTLQAASTTPTSNTQDNSNQTVAANTQNTAQSGNVSAKGNETVGNVTSGNANNTINQVTALNSTTSLDGASGLQTFTYNIDGNHVGNIILSPADFLQSSAATATQNPENATATTRTDAAITNTVGATATSGDVDVAGNNAAGDATSGNAITQANLINMISSVVSDKQAFVGTVNINGSLKGNLLLPKSAISALLPAPTRSAAQNTTNSSSTSTAENNMNVDNNITLDAQSGGVTVTGNGKTGNDTSGNATTNVQLYNLTNSTIVGGNVLLVFVNVMGKWVGLLMNAPAGTTSAALGGSITKDIANGSNNTSSTTDETITNNVNLNSKSGDVAVKGNQSAGNATSGNASANADIVNILGSQVDLTGWLGILIINVYGSWNGSLEIEPAAVTLHVKAPAIHHKTPHTTIGASSAAVDPRNLYSFGGSSQNIALTAGHVLGSTISKAAQGSIPKTQHTATLTNSKHTSGVLTDLIAAAIGMLIVAALATARAFSLRRRNLTT